VKAAAGDKPMVYGSLFGLKHKYLGLGYGGIIFVEGIRAALRAGYLYEYGISSADSRTDVMSDRFTKRQVFSYSY
jgi:hypothetical protein